VMPVPPAIMDSLSMDLPAPSSMYLRSRHAINSAHAQRLAE